MGCKGVFVTRTCIRDVIGFHDTLIRLLNILVTDNLGQSGICKANCAAIQTAVLSSVSDKRLVLPSKVTLIEISTKCL